MIKTISILPVKDTFVSEKCYYKNFHGSETLYVGNQNNQAYHSLLQFDLSCLSQNSSILNATLSLYVLKKEISHESGLIIYPLIKNFEEDIVTWNKYRYSNSLSFYKSISTDVNSFLAINISKYVQNIVNESIPNYGILMMLNSRINNYIGFLSSKYGYETYKPTLNIEVHSEDNELYELVKETIVLSPSETGTNSKEFIIEFIPGLSIFAENLDKVERIALQLQLSVDGFYFYDDGEKKLIEPEKKISFSTASLAKIARIKAYGNNVFSKTKITFVYYKRK